MKIKTELYIYDKHLDFKGVIDSYISLRWKRKYFEAGEFELHLNASSRNKELLKGDNIIVRKDCSEAGLIDSIEIDDSGEDVTIIASGNFLSYLLHRRIIKATINYNGSILNGMRKLLNDMRAFAILMIGATNIASDNIRFQCTYKNVYTYICKLSKASNVGFFIYPDIKNKKLIFNNFVGTDRRRNQKVNPYYEFSEERSNIKKANYLETTKDFYNYCIIGGQGEGAARKKVTIDKTNNYEDFEIRELFVDARNESQEDLTDIEYSELLREIGNERLIDIIKTFDFEAYVEDYKKKWDLGDIVTAKKESLNLYEDLRITEVEEVIESSNYTVTPTFGYPLPDKFVDEE